MAKYNGYPSYNAWNVALWLLNEESVYRRMKTYIRIYGKKKAAEMMAQDLEGLKTPDGVRYTKTNIKSAFRE